jgi:hypothetical protein
MWFISVPLSREMLGAGRAKSALDIHPLICIKFHTSAEALENSSIQDALGGTLKEVI